MTESYVRIRKKLVGNASNHKLLPKCYTSPHMLCSDILKLFSWETCLVMEAMQPSQPPIPVFLQFKNVFIAFPKIYSFLHYLPFIWKQNVPSLLTSSLLNEIMIFSQYCGVYKHDFIKHGLPFTLKWSTQILTSEMQLFLQLKYWTHSTTSGYETDNTSTEKLVVIFS